ncbi:MAG: DUF1049 domain-containing protein [Treponema sp.]|nr:DUF1049 domain-containing protein [Treponema sp.]MBQ1972474.1 DUF1049 domain-containing protein [Treponema sp.]
MIIRLLGTILSLVVLAFFVGFNLDNKCNVNVLVHTFQNVPVFITIIISFVVGVLFTMPFAFSYKSQKKKEAKNNQVQVVDKKTKKLFNKKESKSSVTKAETDSKVETSVQPVNNSAPVEKNSEQKTESKPENTNSTSEGQ